MNEKANEKFKALEKEIFDSILERNPTLATALGIHEYDDSLPIYTGERFLEDIKLRENWRKRMASFTETSLSPKNRIAKDLGLHIVDKHLYTLKNIRHWEQNPSAPQLIGQGIFPLLKREFAPLTERLKSIKGRIEEIPRVLEEEKTKLTDPVKLWINMAIESAQRLPMLFKLVLTLAQREGMEAERLQEFQAAVNEAKNALDEYIEWLKQERKEAKEDFTIGKEKFAKLLEKRELGYTSDEILALGKRLLKEAQEAMEKYADKIDADAETKEVVEQVLSQTPDDFEKAVQWYEEGLNNARTFISEHDLATIPDSEEIEVTETPDYMRHIIPFAAYLPPAKFDEVKRGIYLVTPPREEQHLKKHSYWDVRNTTVHEGYPGHHLQSAAAMTNDDVFRILSRGIETIEGWAHYCEEMMKDHGFDDTPEAKLLQAKDIVWRAARIIVDVKLSTGKMSFDEAVDYLMDTVGMDKDDAVAEVKRYTQNPTYQLSYLLGKHMIKELKEEVKEEMGDAFTEKFFHDTILYAGSVPMKYLREIFQQKIVEKTE